MGYGEGQNGFVCDDPLTRRMRASYNVMFSENVKYYHQNNSNNANQPANLNNYNTCRDFSPFQLGFSKTSLVDQHCQDFLKVDFSTSVRLGN